MQTAQKVTFLSALAFIVVFANTTAAHAASASNGATLFQVAEVSAPAKIAASEDTNTDEKAAEHKCGSEHKNWFQRHCASRLFHHKKAVKEDKAAEKTEKEEKTDDK